ncbi:hypothetical protein O181_044127 [Austropuccinia psidii MF-1]|uniref:Transposase Tc1-like domain-containing protein n=1 Tax=Austropuccinia psidii MF-1 TaxID=1389203 RepID=A0A9Q3DLW0_9BASI|nr:hypothetical protein [Austropuccinia psidii MF-1]
MIQPLRHSKNSFKDWPPYQDEQVLLLGVIKNNHLPPCLTVAQVTNMLTTQVSTRTIQQEIHKLGKQSRISPKKPYLRLKDFQQKLVFAHEHQHWRITDWAQAI